MNTTQGFEGSIETGVLSLIGGIMLPFFFNGLVQGEDVVVFLFVFGVFATTIVYGEIYLSLPSGVAFGVGMLLASFAAQNWWLVGLAATAWMVKLARYAWLESVDEGEEGIDDSFPHTVSEWFKIQTPEE